MAVPKKRMSKSRRNSRRYNWKRKLVKQVEHAISIGKSIQSGNGANFIVS